MLEHNGFLQQRSYATIELLVPRRQNKQYNFPQQKWQTKFTIC